MEVYKSVDGEEPEMIDLPYGHPVHQLLSEDGIFSVQVRARIDRELIFIEYELPTPMRDRLLINLPCHCRRQGQSCQWLWQRMPTKVKNEKCFTCGEPGQERGRYMEVDYK